MATRYSVGQMNQLGDGLESADYSVDQVTQLRSLEVLSQFKLVLMGLATIVRHCLKVVLDKAFNPSEFIGSDWNVWKGPADGNGLQGDDDCVAEPDTVDFDQIIPETHLQGEETSLPGEEKMKRARGSKNRQLGGRAFLALWNDWQTCKTAGKPEDSILEKLRKGKKIGNVIYFFGLTLRDPDGDRNVLYLLFGGRGWYWSYAWLDGRWGAGGPSVALASVEPQS